MDNYSVVDLAHFRLDQAHGCLASSEALMAINQYKDAANRSYYSIFRLKANSNIPANVTGIIISDKNNIQLMGCQLLCI